jgi:hypothetical protein
MSCKTPRLPVLVLSGAVAFSMPGLTAIDAGSPHTVLAGAGAASRSLPVVPKLHVLRNRQGTAPGVILITPQSLPPSPLDGSEILDGRGRPVWFRPVPAGQLATDLRVQRYRGRPVLTWFEGTLVRSAFAGNGMVTAFAYTGTAYIADAHYHVIAKLKGVGDLHEFQLTSRGTALLTDARSLRMDLTSFGGTRNDIIRDGIIKEVDVATGRTLWRWSSLDHIPISESRQHTIRPGDTRPYDYLHINSVAEDRDGNLLVSATNTCTIYKVDRRTGRIIWRLGGRHSTFRLRPGTRFCVQHDAHWAGKNLIRVFDNGTLPRRHAARVAWIKINPVRKTATLVRQIIQPQHRSVKIQGGAQGLPNGDTAVGWGATGRISEYSPNGSPLFDASLPRGRISYRMYRAPWHGRPCTSPTVVTKGSVVHAVWNGATGVARWRVLAGPTENAVKPVAEAAWNGLDTAIALPGTSASEPYVQVQALDARGAVLGTGARGGQARLPRAVGRPGEHGC